LDHIREEPAFDLESGIAALQAQLTGPRAVPEMLRLGCRLRPGASSFGHFFHLTSEHPDKGL